MIVCTYYTNAKYKAFARELHDSCRLVGLHCAVYMEKDQGSWQKNVYRKPHVVRKAMDAYPAEDVLFVDADARLKRFPSDLIGSPWEVACYYPWPNCPCSGTVFVANTERGRAFVDEWARGCDRGQGENEDYHWMRMAMEKIPVLRVGHLEPAYYWIEKDMRGRFPGADPVVVHENVGEHTFK